MKQRIYWAIGIVVVVVAAIVYYSRSATTEDVNIAVKAKRGDFVIDVTTTGELEAKSFVEIQAPYRLRNARINRVTIQRMVPEGTVVQKGQFVAQLDKSPLAERMANEETELEQAEADLEQARVDTALTLRNERDRLINLEFAVEEARLTLEQSEYEPQATIQKNKMNYQKAIRDLTQAKEAYQLQLTKARAQMREQQARYAERLQEFNFLAELEKEFTILAPENGMVIYYRRNNEVTKEGSQISPWDPMIATLPDLSTMISKTYVNEVDIRKIGRGQEVEIGLDAFPDKDLTGRVIEVANVGQTKQNSDSKVFEVRIEINENDTTLRPAMTTSNIIKVEEFEDVVYVPLEAVHSQGDTLNYVITKANLGYRKKQVITGAYNANDIIIENGIRENDEVLLNIPEGTEDLTVELLGEKPKNLAAAQ